MSSQPYIVDFDDFYEDHPRLELLDQIKAEVPGFKATLFTIPGKCTADWLDYMRRTRPWLDLVPHGWLHPHSRECQNWSVQDTRAYVLNLAGLGMTRGFKAPGWQISDATFDILARFRYWIADQPYNRDRRPKGLQVYEVRGDRRIHGHLGHLGGHNANEIEFLLPQLLSLHGQEFGFCRDFLDVTV